MNTKKVTDTTERKKLKRRGAQESGAQAETRGRRGAGSEKKKIRHPSAGPAQAVTGEAAPRQWACSARKARCADRPPPKIRREEAPAHAGTVRA